MSINLADVQMLLCDWAIDPQSRQSELISVFNRWAPQGSDDAKAVLSAFRGTVIEPFYLSPEGLAAASWVASAAFQQGTSRFRIVSDDDLDGGGGVVLTRSMKAYQIFRAPFRRPRSAPSSPWFAPGLAVRQSTRSVRRGTVMQDLTTKGLRVRIPHPFPGKAASLNAEGWLMRSEKPIDRLSMGIAFEAGTAVLTPLSPEGTIRLVAACNAGETLRIVVREGSTSCISLIRLIPVESEKAEGLKSYAVLDPHPSTHWSGLAGLRIPFEDGVLKAKRRQSLAKRMYSPKDWLPYLEELIEA